MMQVNLSVPLFVDNDFGVDDDGSVHILTFVDLNDDDDGLVEVQTSFDKMIEDVIEYWKADNPSEAISYLLSLADTLNRASERCYDTASDIADLRVELEADSYPEL